MAYKGAEAFDLNYMQANPAYPEYEYAPSFEVIEGGGLDAAARRGVSTAFLTRVKLCVVAVILVVALGCLRVAISTATVGQLREVRSLRTEVTELENLNSQLEVERSIEASSQRIVAIATQVYGMQYASEVDTLQISYADADDEQTQETSSQEAELPVVATAEAASEDGR